MSSKLGLWVSGLPVLVRYFGLLLLFFVGSWVSSRANGPLKDAMNESLLTGG
jgi:hypothetical protein